MTLAEMVAQYGEAEVVRWAETGREVDANLKWARSQLDDYYKWAPELRPFYCRRGGLLARVWRRIHHALGAADEA